ncbi:helix-turn-helix domain-containing protein [Variovorax soli]|uniref:helix-turn-helix domain-containing protein n=1 Tax=Variovorax soli TaxID=376815 RepID=UPI0012948610
MSPRQRQRAAHHLTISEREEISRGLIAGTSLRQLALTLMVERDDADDAYQTAAGQSMRRTTGVRGP